MSSKIGVQNIAHTNGTNAMTVSASGVTTFTSVPVNAGGGKVLQTKAVNYKGAMSTTSNTYELATPLSLIITPSSTSSKILCMFQGFLFVSTYTRYGYMSLQRKIGSGSFADITGTTINNNNNNDGLLQLYDGDTHISYRNGGWNFVDSPNNTSALTYTPSFRRGAASATFTVGTANMISSFILMEIAP